MRIRSDGSVQSSGTPTVDNIGTREDYNIYRCVVTKVVYTDDPNNISSNSTNPRVMYDVVVLGGFASGQIISNCRLASNLGGNDSYSERTLRASTQSVSTNRLSDSDGDIVFVAFNQAHPGYPIIICVDNGIDTSGKIGAAKAEGPRSREQYNGVHEQIDNTGALEIKVKGGSANPDKGAFIPNGSPKITLKADPVTEKYTRTFASGLTITEDGPADKVTVITAGGAKVTIDGAADKITSETAGGAKTTVDGSSDKITSETSGGAKVTIDGSSDTVEAEAAGGGKLKIVNNKVALGASPEETLQILSETLQELSVTLGNLGYPLSGASIFAALKTRIDSIKGTL